MDCWSERRFIDVIRENSRTLRSDVIMPIGDDCCELATGPRTLISTDTLVQSVHFDLSFHPPFLLGRKSIAVNLSDIAAMGGVPRFILLSVCLPEDVEWQWINNWLAGALDIIRQYDCALVGGDTVRGDRIVFTVTVLGDPAGSGAIYRSGAGSDDSIWVSGELGSAGAGLALLDRGKYNKDQGDSTLLPFKTLIDAHLDPQPQILLGQKLAASGCVSAMQDISDGLATDLAHICKASGTGARIYEELMPRNPALAGAAQLLARRVDDFLIRSGEDYQLLFTVKAGQEGNFAELMDRQGEKVTRIGQMFQGAGVLFHMDGVSTDVSYQGWEH